MWLKSGWKKYFYKPSSGIGIGISRQMNRFVFPTLKHIKNVVNFNYICEAPEDKSLVFEV